MVIAEAGVLPIHAKIERDGESYVLWDLSHDTLLSTRVAFVENVEITVGSMLLLGNTRLVVTEYVFVFVASIRGDRRSFVPLVLCRCVVVVCCRRLSLPFVCLVSCAFISDNIAERERERDRV